MWTLLTTLALGADLLVGPAQPYLTLEDAFDDAVDGDRILVEPGTYGEGTLDVGARALTVQSTAAGVRIESSAQRRAFTVAGGTLTLVDLEIDGLDDVGLAEVRAGGLTLSGVTVLQARAPNPGQPGGSIDAEDAVVTISQSVLDGAVAPVKDGGHIYALRSVVTVRDSVVRAGSADEGGGLYVSDTALLVERTSFESNHADREGSAIAARGGSVQVYDSAFVGNDASQRATVQCVAAKSCVLNNVLFEANTAPAAAMVDADGVGQLELHGATGCRSTGVGSLIEVTNSSLSMYGTVLTSIDGTGPGVLVGPGAVASLVNNSFVLVTAADHFVQASGDLELRNSLIHRVDTLDAAVDAQGLFTGGYNLYSANLGGDVLPGPFATDLVGVDPLIGNPLPDSCALDPLRPTVGSPLIDGGDPADLDADGTRADIGAFGGTEPNTGVDGLDVDGDGFSSPIDCDDDDPNVNPLAPEVFCNGVDDDCDPTTADDADADGDGISVCSGDCDDADASVFPGAVELLCNGIDDDCDPATLDGDDLDGDGVAGCDGDCDDTNPAVAPGLDEIDCNGLDDDCDPATVDAIDSDGDGVSVCDGDCDDTNERGTYEVEVYLDLDYDGYGVGEPTTFCVPPTNSAILDGDCNNNDDTVYPGATEIPYDGIDQDCDGADLDDLDADGALGADDCDDADPTRFPGNEDVPDDGIAQDCSGSDVSATLVGGAGWRCGCGTVDPGSALGGLLGLALLVRRRRVPRGTAPARTQSD